MKSVVFPRHFPDQVERFTEIIKEKIESVLKNAQDREE